MDFSVLRCAYDSISTTLTRDVVMSSKTISYKYHSRDNLEMHGAK